MAESSDDFVSEVEGRVRSALQAGRVAYAARLSLLALIARDVFGPDVAAMRAPEVGEALRPYEMRKTPAESPDAKKKKRGRPPRVKPPAVPVVCHTCATHLDAMPADGLCPKCSNGVLAPPPLSPPLPFEAS